MKGGKGIGIEDAERRCGSMAFRVEIVPRLPDLDEIADCIAVHGNHEQLRVGSTE